MTAQDEALREAVEREVSELHVCFEAWLGGTAPATVGGLRRCEDVLATSFHIVTPQGRLVPRSELVAQLRNAHGARPRLEIEIRNVRVLDADATSCLATYEEWQRTPADRPKGRISTVLFRRDDGKPNGLAWCHVHETWIETAQG